MSYERDMQVSMAAAAHRKAHPRTKRTAALMGVTDRSVQRWKKRADAKGSPVERYNAALEAAEDPYIMLAHSQVAVERKKLKARSTADLITDYLQLLTEDVLHEGRDNALKLCRATSWEERAQVSAEDAAIEIRKAAIEQEFMVRRVPLSEVFGR